MLRNLFLVIYLIVFYTIPHCSWATPSNGLDSLKAMLSVKSGVERIKALNDLGYRYSGVDPDSGVAYSKQAIELATEVKDTALLATAYGILGINHQAKSDFKEALRCELIALQYFRNIKKEKSIAAMLLNISNLYTDQGNYDAALEYSIDAAKKYERLNLNQELAICCDKIGTIFMNLNDFQTSSNYFSRSMKIYSEMDDLYGIARVTGNKGILLNEQGNHVGALALHQKALEINSTLGNARGIAINLVNIGNAHLGLDQGKTANTYFEDALDRYTSLGNRAGAAAVTGNVGLGFLHIARQEELSEAERARFLAVAIVKLESAADSCRKLGFIEPLVDFENNLSDAYLLTGNYEKAFSHFRRHKTLEDSLYSNASYNRLAGMELEFQIENQNKELQLKDQELIIKDMALSQNRIESIIFSILIILLLFLMYVIWRKFRRTRGNYNNLTQKYESQIETIEKQMSDLSKHATVLKEVVYIQAHEVRGPVTTLLSMSELFNRNDYSDPTNKYLIDSITQVTAKLDEAVKDVILKCDTIRNNAGED